MTRKMIKYLHHVDIATKNSVKVVIFGWGYVFFQICFYLVSSLAADAFAFQDRLQAFFLSSPFSAMLLHSWAEHIALIYRAEFPALKRSHHHRHKKISPLIAEWLSTRTLDINAQNLADIDEQKGGCTFWVSGIPTLLIIIGKSFGGFFYPHLH